MAISIQAHNSSSVALKRLSVFTGPNVVLSVVVLICSVKRRDDFGLLCCLINKGGKKDRRGNFNAARISGRNTRVKINPSAEDIYSTKNGGITRTQCAETITSCQGSIGLPS